MRSERQQSWSNVNGLLKRPPPSSKGRQKRPRAKYQLPSRPSPKTDKARQKKLEAKLQYSLTKSGAELEVAKLGRPPVKFWRYIR
jgi:hypothetical protein